MTWRRRQNQSHWREFEFMLQEIRRAVDPGLPLATALRAWARITRRLAENPRRRRPRRYPDRKNYLQTS
jgi:hypothetical protein